MRISKKGLTHRQAFCSNCDFWIAFGGDDSAKKILLQVRYHVKKTGHSVKVEDATFKTYKPDVL